MYAINPNLEIISKNQNLFAKINEKIFPISNEELLVLKIISENLNPITVSEKFNIPLKCITYNIESCLSKKLISREKPLLTRENNDSPEVFILQWHITNKCDLNCKHCYDRTKRDEISYNDTINVMKDLYIFCFKYSVFPQITFTGGNPFLHKDFIKLYKNASEMGFIIGILGNPVEEKKLVEILKIQKPSFYQISLEGMEEYNDFIRGKGHFKKAINFLKILKKYEIYASVMLTLHKGNINQVFELIKILEGIADSFTFNRLSLVGEGENLQIFSKDEYIEFLKKYIEIAKDKPFVRLKDNLINILLYKKEKKFFGGCTGFGCGAAFNFVALLPDGEVHACRKFPSFIGNIIENTLEEIYFSEKAKNYREGPEECKNCPINFVCRGCLAVIYNFHKDVKKFKDPYCFFNKI